VPAELLERKAPDARPGAGSPGGRGAAGGGGEHAPRPGPGILGDPELFALCAFLAAVTMLFIAMTSAYMFRRAAGDWRPLTPPALLWLNTALLLASSATLEQARRRLRSWDVAGARGFVAATGLLGAVFVAGQYGAWQALRAEGVYLASNPHSSFFYVLTGLHALHLLGGLAWFARVARRLPERGAPPGPDALRLFAVYWHFLGALWVYLVLLLFVL
jgi:cytochrome c oxidase subunit 3